MENVVYIVVTLLSYLWTSLPCFEVIWYSVLICYCVNWRRKGSPISFAFIFLIVMMQSLMAYNNGVAYDLMLYYEQYLTEPYVLFCWTIQLQEWIETN